MVSRYRLRPFAPTDTAAHLLEQIFPKGKGSASALAGVAGRVPWETVVTHLRAIGAVTLLVQAGVRDPDFLEEHQAFYAKQHRGVLRSCVRVHAFKLPINESLAADSDDGILQYLDDALADASSYLGFVTIRPLRHAPVGATILVDVDGGGSTVFDDFPVHIAGNGFAVRGTPFLQQDNAVGACAQASIWMALRTIRRRQGNAAYSPAELTVAATRYLATDRSFPGRQGLTIQQMLEAVKFAGHDPLHLALRMPESPPADSQAVLCEALPYIESGLPVITALMSQHGGHAVVAIGRSVEPHQVVDYRRRYRDGSITFEFLPSASFVSALVIHNDNSGPYLRLAPGDPRLNGYCLEQTTSLIVTLPEGVFTTAAEAELLATRAIVLVSAIYTAPTGSPSLPLTAFVLRPYLCTRHAFRRWAKGASLLSTEVGMRYRSHELPRYMWVIEIHDAAHYDPTDPSKQSRCGEVVLDASADPLHADGLIFARVTSQLWPGVSGIGAGMLFSEDESGPSVIALSSGAPCEALLQPWD